MYVCSHFQISLWNQVLENFSDAESERRKKNKERDAEKEGLICRRLRQQKVISLPTI
jgi:hypothetical protein